MTITETSRGYELQFDFRPNIVKELKAIPGTRFQGKERGWFVPHIGERKNEDKTVTKFVNKEAMEKFKAKYTKLAAGVNSPEVIYTIKALPKLNIHIPLNPPFSLYPYQQEDVARGMELESFINAMPPGCGKTLESIATILGWEQTGKEVFPVLVICPSALKENWRREWQEKFTNRKAVLLDDSNKSNWHHYYNMRMGDVFIVNYESLKKFFLISTGVKGKEKPTLKSMTFNMVKDVPKTIILDEAHKLKDTGTMQAKIVKGITTGKQHVIALTGTPVVNRSSDLISILAIINKLHLFGGYKFFMDRYCKTGKNVDNHYNELNGKLNEICFFRREKKEVLKDLPDKSRTKAICDISTRAEYNEAVHTFQKYLTDNGYTAKEIDKKLKAEVLVKIGLLKKLSAVGKMQEVYEYVDDLIECDEKVVLFIHSREVAEALMKKYPHAVTVRGADNAEAKQRSVDAFQGNPDIKLIIVSIKAGGVGLTLTSASNVGFVELPWHDADCDQCESRCHRIGVKSAVTATYFLGKDTIDEKIYQIIEEKRKTSSAITGSTESIDTIVEDLTRSLFNQKTR